MHLREPLPDTHKFTNPHVDPQIHEHINLNARGCICVDVDRYVDDKPKRAGSIILDTPSHTMMPPEAIADIALQVARIQHHAWDLDVPHAPQKFRILVVKKPPGKNTKARIVCGDLWFDGEAAGEEPEVAEYDISAEVAALERTVRQQGQMVDMLFIHCGSLQDKFLEVQDKLVSSATAGADALNRAMPIFLAGFQSQLHGEKLKYAEKKAEAEAAGRERIWKAALDKVDSVAPIAKYVLGQILAKGAGPGGPPPPGFPGFPGGGAPPSGPTAPGASVDFAAAAKGASDPAGEGGAAGADGLSSVPGAEPTAAELANPLRTLVWAFHHSMRPGQSRKLNALLEPAEVDLWYALCESQSDAEVHGRYAELKSASGDKLIKLLPELDDFQQQQLMAVLSTCESPPAPSAPPPAE